MMKDLKASIENFANGLNPLEQVQNLSLKEVTKVKQRAEPLKIKQVKFSKANRSGTNTKSEI